MLCVAKHGSLMSNEYIFFGGNIKIICKGLTLFMHGMVRNQLLIDLSFKQTAQWKLEIFNGLNFMGRLTYERFTYELINVLCNYLFHAPYFLNSCIAIFKNDINL